MSGRISADRLQDRRARRDGHRLAGAGELDLRHRNRNPVSGRHTPAFVAVTRLPPRSTRKNASAGSRSSRTTGSAHNGTVLGVSETEALALPPTMVPMWPDHNRDES